MSAPFQKHIGLFQDKKLTFHHHLNEKISKANKGIGLIKGKFDNMDSGRLDAGRLDVWTMRCIKHRPVHMVKLKMQTVYLIAEANCRNLNGNR